MKYAQIGMIALIAATGLVYFANNDTNKAAKAVTSRFSDYPILDVILHRWSPRAMSGEAISEAELMTILEAGRWAPSTYNDQPWHFVYCKNGSEGWNNLFNTLVPFNQVWCVNGSILLCILSAKICTATGQPSPTHLLDAGAAAENMALQASSMGLVMHGMSGFDYEEARKVLRVSDDYDVAMLFVIGKPAPASTLPKELAEREMVQSDRRPLAESISEDVFTPQRKQ